MASAVSTFGIFQSLLTSSVTNDTTLDAATKASMLTRINELARGIDLRLDISNVESVTGQAVKNEALNAIEIGTPGTSRVEWNSMTFTVPVDIDGTAGEDGFLPGHGGDGADPLVTVADISLQYRLTAAGAWQAFRRTTLLKGVTFIQFAADVADPTLASVLPQINLVANQV